MKLKLAKEIEQVWIKQTCTDLATRIRSEIDEIEIARCKKGLRKNTATSAS